MQSLAFGRKFSRDADRAGEFVRRSKQEPAGVQEGLVSLLGNQAVQGLLGDVAHPVGCACGGSACAAHADDDLALGLLPRTTPLETLEDLEELEGSDAPLPSLTPVATPSDGGPPDPSTMGGSVICTGGRMTVWTNPTNDPCLVDCIRRHEEKHVADFSADPAYADACTVVPEGHTFFYENANDARRFETAATDVEIACLQAQYPGASATCQPLIAQRRDVTLPNYKRSFSRGC